MEDNEYIVGIDLTSGHDMTVKGNLLDEMHSICIRCGSENRECIKTNSDDGRITTRTMACKDCGYKLTSPIHSI